MISGFPRYFVGFRSIFGFIVQSMTCGALDIFGLARYVQNFYYEWFNFWVQSKFEIKDLRFIEKFGVDATF